MISHSENTMDAKTIAKLREHIDDGSFLAHDDPEGYAHWMSLYELPTHELCSRIITLEKENAHLKDRLTILSEKLDFEKSGAGDVHEQLPPDAFDDDMEEFPTRFESLEADLQNYIVDKEAFGQIVYALNTRVLDYIRKAERQSLWDVVRYILQYKGFLKKNLSRIKFATLLVTLCPCAGEAKKIKQNMEQCPLTSGKRKPEDFDSLPDDNELKKVGKEILALFS